MVRKLSLGLLFALLYASLGSAAFAQSVVTPDPRVDASGPNQLIETAANTMITELDARRADVRKNPDRLYGLVERVLLPHFDVDYAGRLVLGKHYRSATPEQRKRFIDAFYGSLMGNYGDALLEFTGDRIKVLPTPTPADATAAVVRTEVKRSNGEKVPVNHVLRKAEPGWNAWDVEIDQKGLDAVIERLEAQHKNPRKPANGAK